MAHGPRCTLVQQRSRAWVHGDEGEGTSERPASPGERTYVRTCATRSRSPAKPEALQYTPRVSIGVESFGSLRPGNSTTGWLAVGTLRILKLAQDVPTLRSLHTYEYEFELPRLPDAAERDT